MGKAKAKAEAIQLIKSLPCTHSAWLRARWGPWRQLRVFRDVLVEMRDSALLLYPPAKAAGRTAEDERKLVTHLSAQYVEMVPLREAHLTAHAKSLCVTIHKPDNTGSIDVRFPDKALFDDWTLQVRELAGLRHVTLADFEIERHVGKGASGRVYLVQDRETRESLALKVIDKATVYESADSYRHALDERIVLELAANHPFILDMRYAFQNRERLFLVTEYCGGGDLFEYLNKKSRPMEEGKARHVVAEILLALEHVHSLGVVYRDLKLENVLLDRDGHVRVADFGLSKMLGSRSDVAGGTGSGSVDRTGSSSSAPSRLKKTKTFCGTREYVAPEMLGGDPYDTTVDLWAFGILLYEILCGRTPFYSRQRNEIYERIEKAPVFYPKDMSDEVQELLKGLLERDVEKRLGAGPAGIAEIKAHPWFALIDWDDLYAMRPHANSIANEIRQMNCGKGASPTASTSSKKTKRQVDQERAMRVLMDDCASDIKAVGRSSPRTMRSQDGNGPPTPAPGVRAPKVVPVSASRKRTPIIAGYSFVGKGPNKHRQGAGGGGDYGGDYGGSYAGGPAYRNPSEGYKRSNVFVPSPTSGTDSTVTDDVVPNVTRVTDVRPAVPALSRISMADEDDACAVDSLISPASPGNLDDLVDKIIETRRESNAQPQSSALPSPSTVLQRRHIKRLAARQERATP
jgi:serine/threonine protein kinase